MVQARGMLFQTSYNDFSCILELGLFLFYFYLPLILAWASSHFPYHVTQHRPKPELVLSLGCLMVPLQIAVDVSR